MRSDTPKVLHTLCGRPMVLHVVDALAELPLERIVVVVGHGAERVTKTLQEQLVTEVPVEFVEQRVQRGTGDAVSVALTLFDDLDAEDDILVLPSDAPLVRAETHRQARDPAPRRGRGRDACSPPASADADRPRTGRARQGRSRRPHRRARGRDRRRARDRRDQHVDLLLPPQPARARAAPAEPRERARRVLPDRRGRRAARGRPQGRSRSRPRIPAKRSWSTTAPSSPTPKPSCGRGSTAAGCATASRWSTPTRTYVDATVEIEPDVRILPGTILEGRTSIGAGSVIGPDCRLVDAVVGERRTHLQRGRASTPRSATTAPSGPYAYLRPGHPPRRRASRSGPTSR